MESSEPIWSWYFNEGMTYFEEIINTVSKSCNCQADEI
jgi:hypothetical protein